MQQALVLDSYVLPDGHLACPERFIQQKNIQFKILVLFDETEKKASQVDMEYAAVKDTGDDFLSREELNYYLALDEGI